MSGSREGNPWPPILSGRGNCSDATAVSLTPMSEQYAERCARSNDAAALAGKAGAPIGRVKNFADECFHAVEMAAYAGVGDVCEERVHLPKGLNLFGQSLVDEVGGAHMGAQDDETFFMGKTDGDGGAEGPKSRCASGRPMSGGFRR